MVPCQATQDLEDTLNPWMLTRSILLHPAQEKGDRVHETVIFNEIAMFTVPHANAMASNRLAKANRASHG